MDESTAGTITGFSINLFDRHAYRQRGFRAVALLKSLATHLRQYRLAALASALFYDFSQLALDLYNSECGTALRKQPAASNFLLFRIARSDIDFYPAEIGMKVIRFRNFPQGARQEVHDWQSTTHQETFNPVCPVQAASLANNASGEQLIASRAAICCCCVRITLKFIESTWRKRINRKSQTVSFEPASAGESK